MWWKQQELEVKVKPEEVMNCCNFIIKLMDKEVLLTDEQSKWLSEMDSTPGEDAVKTIEKTTRYLFILKLLFI